MENSPYKVVKHQTGKVYKIQKPEGLGLWCPNAVRVLPRA